MVAAYATVLLALLFTVGMKIVAEDATDYRKGVIAGIAFWLGVGFQNGVIFPEYLSGFAGGFLENGMTAGGLAAMIMTLFVEVSQPRRQPPAHRVRPVVTARGPAFRGRLRRAQRLGRPHEGPARSHRRGSPADPAGIHPRRRGSLGRRCDRCRFRGRLRCRSRADAAAADAAAEAGRYSFLRIAASKRDGRAIVEFAAAVDEDNLEDRIAVLTEQAAGLPAERDVSLRILQHHATSVLHQQYHGLDIVTVHVT